MGWKSVVGVGSVLAAVLGGCWWAVAASAAPPAPVIGPPLVVTLVPGTSPTGPARVTAPASPAGSRPGPPTSAGEVPSPEAVDPRWVRPVDDDDHDEGAEVNDD